MCRLSQSEATRRSEAGERTERDVGNGPSYTILATGRKIRLLTVVDTFSASLDPFQLSDRGCRAGAGTRVRTIGWNLYLRAIQCLGAAYRKRRGRGFPSGTRQGGLRMSQRLREARSGAIMFKSESLRNGTARCYEIALGECLWRISRSPGTGTRPRRSLAYD